jgi:hypothetical protein
MEPMLAIYLVFIIIGFFGLGSSFIFDFDGGADDLADGVDVGDTFNENPKIFSLRVIFAFLMSFSIGGGAMYFNDHHLTGQLLVGFGAGIVTAAFVWWITSILMKMQGASNVNSDNFIGKTGDISVGTSSSGKAKVRIATTSGPLEVMCKEANDKKLKHGDLVKVSVKIGTLLMVTKK